MKTISEVLIYLDEQRKTTGTPDLKNRLAQEYWQFIANRNITSSIAVKNFFVKRLKSFFNTNYKYHSKYWQFVAAKHISFLIEIINFMDN